MLISTTHWTTQFHGAVSCSSNICNTNICRCCICWSYATPAHGLRAPWAGVANSQTDRHRAKVTVGAYMWALSCRSLSTGKLRGHLFTIFTAYIVCVFLACIYCDRFSAWSCPVNRAVYSTPHSVWSVYKCISIVL